MEHLFEKLIGDSVRDVQALNETIVSLEKMQNPSIVEGWRIVIGRANILVYNQAWVEGQSGKMTLSSIKDLILQKVIYEETKSLLTMHFSGGTILNIDLSPEKYNGPEALVLERPGEPIVVI